MNLPQILPWHEDVKQKTGPFGFDDGVAKIHAVLWFNGDVRYNSGLQ